METTVKSPHAIFNMPQRLLVPLFQRPYVWNEEKQWEPLWRDVERVAERLMASPNVVPQPHFLGAVVFQQIPNPAGDLQVRTIIDGQQRLTTLQIMLDAFHGELSRVGAERSALRLSNLVRNDDEYCNNYEDQFKVWPTNRDRTAFYEVMSAPAPVDYSTLVHEKERLPSAHKYFATQAAKWLAIGNGDIELAQRAEHLERTVRELLQLVVIDLTVDENAQEIFETLNSRGAQLSAADLIKNFVFQRLQEAGADTEVSYDLHWKHFETSFWEEEVSQGRLVAPRSSWFLNHFLTARLGEVVNGAEVFTRFKHFADHDAGLSMMQLLQQLHRASDIYKAVVEGAPNSDSAITRLALFSYRTKAMDSDVIKPILLVLLDPEQTPLPDQALTEALRALESFLVRRMIVRVTTKSYTRVVADLVGLLRKTARDRAAVCIVEYFGSQTADGNYWPDDDEVSRELESLQIYRRLARGRSRMLLEALEDHRRGWDTPEGPVAEQRVPRGILTIEHILPQKWDVNWPLSDGESEASRNGIIHRLGNLTLLTQKLNSKVSNGAWLGDTGKREAIAQLGTLLLNQDIVKASASGWAHQDVVERTASLTAMVLQIWPTPVGHSMINTVPPQAAQTCVAVVDLLNAGYLQRGARLEPAPSTAKGRHVTVLSDGRLEVDDGKIFQTLSAAGKHVAGNVTVNGWVFWKDATSGRPIFEIRTEYRSQFEMDETDNGE